MHTSNSVRSHRSNWLLWIPLGLGLIVSGCAGKSFSDYLPTAAGAVGAAAGAAVCGPACAATGSAIAGATTETAIPEPVRQLSDNPEVAQSQLKYEAIEDIAYYLIAGFVIFCLALILIGRLIPNGKQRRLERLMFDDPNYKQDDLK